MSTISPAVSAAHHSPKQRILDGISQQSALGTISSSDRTALDGAVESIDDSLRSARSSSSSRLDPSELKSRVDDLVAQQVSSGALTGDQADTLKQILAQGPGGQGSGIQGSSGQGSVGQDSVGQAGRGGIGGAGGPPPGPPPGPPSSDDASADAGDSTTGSASATGTTGSSAGDLLASFIKQLQASQSQAGTYGSTGGSGGRLTSALLLNFEA